jgi:putative membrane protein
MEAGKDPALEEEKQMFRKILLAGASALITFGTAAMSHEGPHINDSQIAHIAYTAGQIDVEAARQALAKSSNKQVRAFAETMVRDHEAVNSQALALVKKLGVTPEANPISAALSAGAAAKTADLARLNGAAFDRAYAQNEVAFHQTVNGALHTTLIPNAKNGELKSLLQTGLALFREHQGHAEHLAGELRR